MTEDVENDSQKRGMGNWGGASRAGGGGADAFQAENN